MGVHGQDTCRPAAMWAATVRSGPSTEGQGCGTLAAGHCQSHARRNPKMCHKGRPAVCTPGPTWRWNTAAKPRSWPCGAFLCATARSDTDAVAISPPGCMPRQQRPRTGRLRNSDRRDGSPCTCQGRALYRGARIGGNLSDPTSPDLAWTPAVRGMCYGSFRQRKREQSVREIQ